MAVEIKVGNTKVLIDSLIANLNYWYEIDKISIDDQKNIQRLLSIGFVLEKCQEKSIDLMLKIFHQIEEWGNYQKWIDILTNDKTIFYSLSSKFKQALLVGKLFELKKDFNSALIWYEDCEKNSNGKNGKRLNINLFVGLYIVHWSIGNNIEAEKYKSLLGEMLEDNLDEDVELLLLNGLVLLLSEDFIMAKKVYKRAYSISMKNKNEHRLAISAINLSLVLYNLAETDNEMFESLNFIAQATQALNELDRHEEVLRLEILKGLIYFRSGNQKRALEVIRNISNSQEWQEEQTGNMLWQRLAKGFESAIAGETDYARKEFKECLKIAEDSGDYSVRKLVEKGLVDFK